MFHRRALLHACAPLVAAPVPPFVFFSAASQSSDFAGSGTLSFPHTPVGNPSGVVVGVLLAENGGITVSGVTYGGVSLPLLISSSQTGGGWKLHLFGSNSSIPSGTKNTVVTLSGSPWFAAQCTVSVTGSTGFETPTTAHGTSATPSLSTPSQSGELVVDFVANDQALSETVGGAQTLRTGPVQSGGGIMSTSTLDAIPGASTPMSWTQGASQSWIHSAVAFS